MGKGPKRMIFIVLLFCRRHEKQWIIFYFLEPFPNVLTKIVEIILLANMVMQFPENRIILDLWQVHCNTLGFININWWNNGIGQRKLYALPALQTEVDKCDYFSSLYVKQNIHTIHIQQAPILVLFWGGIFIQEYMSCSYTPLSCIKKINVWGLGRANILLMFIGECVSWCEKYAESFKVANTLANTCSEKDCYWHNNSNVNMGYRHNSIERMGGLI